jgi:hypothetical protein
MTQTLQKGSFTSMGQFGIGLIKDGDGMSSRWGGVAI